MPKSLQYTVVNSVQWSTLHCNGQNCTAIANMVQLCCNVLQWSTKVPTTLSQASWSMTPAHFRGTTGRKGEKTIVLAVNAIVVPAIQSLFQQCQHICKLDSATSQGSPTEMNSWHKICRQVFLDFHSAQATGPQYLLGASLPKRPQIPSFWV